MASVGSSPSSTSRLPTYRSTYARYHPYPMVGRPRDEDYLLKTVDRRGPVGGLEAIIEEPEAISSARPLVAFEELPDRDFFLSDVGGSFGDNDLHHQSEREHDAPVQVTSGHRKLAAAFVNMMFTLRRKYLALVAVADFLKGKEAETK